MQLLLLQSATQSIDKNDACARVIAQTSSNEDQNVDTIIRLFFTLGPGLPETLLDKRQLGQPLYNL